MLVVYRTLLKETFVYPTFERGLKVIFEDERQLIRIRNMSFAELVQTRENWFVAEGWPGIKYTMHATYANDHDGFYFLEKDGQKIASISVVTYPAINFAYIGCYVVTKPFRWQGLGKLIITQGIEHAASKQDIASFGLNCGESAVTMYQRYGFKTSTVDEFWRYTVQLIKSIAQDNNKSTREFVELPILDEELFKSLVEFDTSILGACREDFLKNFISKPKTVTMIWQEDGTIHGYGIMSEREPAKPEEYPSYKIGPLYADNTSIANILLTNLISALNPRESVYLETPGNNLAAKNMVQTLGFEQIGGMQHKMFKGEPPKFDTKRIFCYSSIAIGG